MPNQITNSEEAKRWGLETRLDEQTRLNAQLTKGYVDLKTERDVLEQKFACAIEIIKTLDPFNKEELVKRLEAL